MQQPQQIQGGLGSLDAPRQGYFLGKLVKKAKRGIKKVFKSPLGKMALIGGLGYGLGGAKFLGGKGMFAGGQGLSRFGNLANLFRASGVGGAAEGKRGMLAGALFDQEGKFSPGRAALTGLAGASIALPFLGGGGDDDEEPTEQMDVAAVRNRARNFYSGRGEAGVGLEFMPNKKYVSQNFYAADGGRAGYAMGGEIMNEDEEDFIRSGAGQSFRQQETFLNMGGGAGEAQAEQMLMAEFIKYKNKGGDLSFQQFIQAVMQQQDQSQGMEQPTMMAADGGRIGYNNGGDPLTEYEIYKLGNMGYDVAGKGMEPFGGLEVLRDILRVNRADGGMAGMTVPGYGTPAGTNQFGYPSGGVRVGKAEGGIMDTEQAEMIDMGGQEKDYRDEGGFVAMGGEERADDVPARLSKNEFVFTADAVRNAGGGDIDRGSEVMQNLMDNLEQGGQVSEDSQGLGGGEEMMMSEEMIEEPNGAQAMYEQQQELQSRMI